MRVYLQSYLPAFLTKPTSASTAWQISQRKQSGCQLLFMALMTRPMMNSPEGHGQRLSLVAFLQSKSAKKQDIKFVQYVDIRVTSKLAKHQPLVDWLQPLGFSGGFPRDTEAVSAVLNILTNVFLILNMEIKCFLKSA